MPAFPSTGQSGAPSSWFRTPPGAAVIDSQSGTIARALAERAGQHWLWLGPDAVDPHGPDAGGRGLRLAPAGAGWHGDIACGLPLPLPSEAFATVVLQHVASAGQAASEALLAEAARILLPGGRLWLFALNPLSPYRWRWRGHGLSAHEPLTWRRRLRAHGLSAEPVSQGLGPTWQVAAAPQLQHGPGMRAAYLLRAEKRTQPLTPVRQRGAIGVAHGVPAA